MSIHFTVPRHVLLQTQLPSSFEKINLYETKAICEFKNDMKKPRSSVSAI